METADLPVDTATWFFALVPSAVLRLSSAARRWTAPRAGPVGMFVAAAVACFVPRSPIKAFVVANAKGSRDATLSLCVVRAASAGRGRAPR